MLNLSASRSRLGQFIVSRRRGGLVTERVVGEDGVRAISSLREPNRLRLAFLLGRHASARRCASCLFGHRPNPDQPLPRDLSRAGWAARERADADRREAVLSLTPKGRKARRKIAAELFQPNAELIEGLDEEKLKILSEVADLLIEGRALG